MVEGSEAFFCTVLADITAQFHAEVESVEYLTYIQSFNNVDTSINFAIA